MKTIVSMNIDSEIHERFKKHVGSGNVSSTIESIMESRLNASNPAKAVDLEIAKIKLEEAETIITEKSAEAAVLKEQLDAAEQEANEAGLAALEAERARILLEGECVQCHQCLGLKPVTVRSGKMCSTCFRSLPAHILKDLV